MIEVSVKHNGVEVAYIIAKRKKNSDLMDVSAKHVSGRVVKLGEAEFEEADGIGPLLRRMIDLLENPET